MEPHPEPSASQSKNRGYFITFEGVDGCGKTTQSKLLVDYLNSIGITTIWTREPGGGHNGEKIRKLFKELKNTKVITDLLLINAARYEHVHDVIVPALKSGTWVVCDRFVDSSICYQGDYKDHVIGIHKWLFGDFYPDITFYIDTRVIDIEERTARRSIEEQDKYDHISTKLELNLRFKNLCLENPVRFRAIDGSANIKDVHKEVKSHLYLHQGV